MPPKGWKKEHESREDRGIELPKNTIIIPMPSVVPARQEPETEFNLSRWYIYTGTPGIMLGSSGRILKWSIIKFEVIKIVDDVIAVRFEDGSFEAISEPDFTKFKSIPSPRY